MKGADHPYRILVETINEGTASLLAADGTVVYANRLLAKMLKMPLRKLIGSSFYDYVPPSERPWFDALLSLGRQGASKGEMPLQAADGALLRAYLSLSSMKLEDVSEAVCLAVTDLTEQKRLEEILAQGRLSRAILEQAEHVIVVCDANGVIIQASWAAQKLAGGNPLLRRFEEVFPISLISCEKASGRPSAQAFYLDSALRGQVYGGVEATFKPAEGQEFCLLLDAGPISGENGEALGCVVILTHITERKRQEGERQRLLEEQRGLTEELTATNEELAAQAEELMVQRDQLEDLNQNLQFQRKFLEAANEELEAFSYSVSHDLKVPVRTIEGFSRMLVVEHADRLDAEGLRLLKVITDSTKLMHSLIDDLLALSRLGRMQIRKSVINLANMAGQVFEKLRSEMPERDIRLTVGDLPPCPGDQDLLYQVMTNLLDNASKFTKSRKTALIEVGGRTEGNENIYHVRDNGIGFDKRYADNLFRPFHRLQPKEEGYEGTGVGLAIVKRIIHRHGGRVWAEGKVNKGATFYFALPNNGV